MQQLEASLALKASAVLGEGPVWDAVTNTLYWLDIKSKRLFRWHPLTAEQREWKFDQMIGCIALTSSADVVCALQDKVVLLDTVTSQVTDIVPLEPELPENRANDGKVDAAGRFWIGTLHIPGDKNKAALYMMDKNRQLVKKADGLSLSNGLGWSPDGKTFYLVDTLEDHVLQYEFNPENGDLSDRRVILDFSDADGSPDGMCVDAEGMLWIAFYGGKRVGRYDPASGKQLAEIAVPAVNVTCCVFGGETLDTLYITTARDGVSEDELTEYPLTGSLFMINPGVKGQPGNRFNL